MRAIGTFVLGLIVVIWSGATFVDGLLTYPFRLAAERLEEGAAPELGYYTTVRGELKRAEGALPCSRDMARSAASIRLVGIDAALKALDLSASTAALSDARSALRESLRCFPQDGNLWLRLAMVEQALGSPKADIERMMALSQATAPRERWVLLPRLAFALKLTELRVADVADVLRQDIETLLRYAPIADVRDVYAKADAASRGIFQASMATLDDERRGEVEEALKDVG